MIAETPELTVAPLDGHRGSGRLARDQGLAEALTVLQSTVEGENWRRASRRQGAIIGMEAFRGQAIIEGQVGALLPLLALGQITHAGAHAALGIGRYRIVGLSRI